MVGGRVIGIVRRATSTLLNVRDRDGRECAVRCEERRTDVGEPVEVRIGDAVWWQGGEVLWTPQGVSAAGRRFTGGRANYDVPLPRVGYSH